ncbi:hypothetical protein ABZS63_37645, partial [Streptomyces sp. NPDC005568]
MALTIPGFDQMRVPGADGVEVAVAVGGSGPPVVLLHGFPQTHLMWRHVAERLVEQHTVICPGTAVARAAAGARLLPGVRGAHA